MPRARLRHRPLRGGLGIRSYTGTEDNLSYVEGGTLTGLATRNISNKRVLVTALHVMAGKDDENNFQNPSGNEMMFQGGSNWDKKVGSNIDCHPIDFEDANAVDLAVLDLDDGVPAVYKPHNPGSHTDAIIIAGAQAPARDMRVTMFGSVSGEISGTIGDVDDEDTFNGADFNSIMYVRWDRSVAEGDSGSPVLYEVVPGAVYRMVGVLFAFNGLRPRSSWAFWASKAERAKGFTFGEKVPELALNEAEGFDGAQYRLWQILTDFSNDNLGLDAIDTEGTNARWSGADVPATGGTHRWWHAYIPASGTPRGIRFVVRGGPDTHQQFVAGRKWGFRVYIKRIGDGTWRHVLSGSDELAEAGFVSGSDSKVVAEADFTVPLTTGARDWLEYFKTYRKGGFEVRIDGAPANRAPIAKAVATPNPAAARSEVTLDGSASTDPDGDALSYSWEQPTEAGGDATSNRVALTGANTAEASFDAPASPQTLAFTLTVEDPSGLAAQDTVDVVVLGPGVEYLGTLTEGDTTASGTWSSDIASVHLLGRYAKFYAFRLNRRGRVRLTLESSVDTYMFLLAGAGKNGVVLQRNDDYGSTLDSRITRTLDAGDYTIEATTYWVGRTGDFDLVARLMSGDAALSVLDLSAGELSPAFAAGETSYTASVEHTQNTITVTPTANHRDATITAKGVATASGTASAALPLLAGDNDIDVVVTAEDGTQRTYSITVTRAANPTPTPTTPPGCTEWGPWTDTSETSGCGRARRRLQRRHCLEGVGQPQEQWVDDPEDLSTPWGPWTETSETRGQCDDWEIKEARTRLDDCGRPQTQEQWVTWEGPAETWGSWSSWTETSETRGQCDDWEIKETRTRTSNRCRTQTQERWVTWEGPAETWGSWSSWSDTGRTPRFGDGARGGTGADQDQQPVPDADGGAVGRRPRKHADADDAHAAPTETWGLERVVGHGEHARHDETARRNRAGRGRATWATRRRRRDGWPTSREIGGQ